jgi:hypothetical protein
MVSARSSLVGRKGIAASPARSPLSKKIGLGGAKIAKVEILATRL